MLARISFLFGDSPQRILLTRYFVTQGRFNKVGEARLVFHLHNTHTLPLVMMMCPSYLARQLGPTINKGKSRIPKTDAQKLFKKKKSLKQTNRLDLCAHKFYFAHLVPTCVHSFIYIVIIYLWPATSFLP